MRPARKSEYARWAAPLAGISTQPAQSAGASADAPTAANAKLKGPSSRPAAAKPPPAPSGAAPVAVVAPAGKRAAAKQTGAMAKKSKASMLPASVSSARGAQSSAKLGKAKASQIYEHGDPRHPLRKAERTRTLNRIEKLKAELHQHVGDEKGTRKLRKHLDTALQKAKTITGTPQSQAWLNRYQIKRTRSQQLHSDAYCKQHNLILLGLNRSLRVPKFEWEYAVGTSTLQGTGANAQSETAASPDDSEVRRLMPLFPRHRTPPTTLVSSSP